MAVDEAPIERGSDDDGFLHGKLTKEIIGAAFEVHRVLGYGFLENVYKHSMRVALDRRGVPSAAESEVRVLYKQVVVGVYKADLLMDGKVIVEFKVAKAYNAEDEAQLLNELKATGMRVGLLINFGRNKVEFKRFAY